MKLLCSALFVFLFVGIHASAQTTSPTPMPPTKVSVSSVIPENPIKYSKPIFEMRNTTQNIVVNARASKIPEFAATGFRLEILFHERSYEEKFYDVDNETIAFSVDGQIFPVTKKTSSLTTNFGSTSIEPYIYSQAFRLDVPPDKVSSFSKAESIIVIWNRANIEINRDGLSILQKFISDEVNEILLFRKASN